MTRVRAGMSGVALKMSGIALKKHHALIARGHDAPILARLPITKLRFRDESP
jgi:hypothetical protein